MIFRRVGRGITTLFRHSGEYGLAQDGWRQHHAKHTGEQASWSHKTIRPFAARHTTPFTPGQTFRPFLTDLRPLGEAVESEFYYTFVRFLSTVF